MRSAAQQLLHWIVWWFLWSVLAACTFDPPSRLRLPYPPEATPFTHDSDKEEYKLFEEPGEMVVYQGRACARSDERITDAHDTQKYLRVRGYRSLEERLDQATVFLSGWEFRFVLNDDLEEDHQVGGLGTAIFNIQKDATALRWEAWGAISDRDFDDPYDWCYHYTLVAWSSAAYAAVADHRDVHAFLNASGTDTALSYNARATTTAPIGQDPVPNSAILPRGFGFLWKDPEHKLLQLAYNLDFSEQFIASDKDQIQLSPSGLDWPAADIPRGKDIAAPHIRSWETKSILKDDALRHDYDTGEVVSVISSLRGRMVQPPFTIEPNQDRSACVCGSYPDLETRTVEGLPFDVAIPILTGWDLQYCCDDQNVKAIGVYIGRFQYAPSRGRLEYTLSSTLHDEDEDDSTVFRHRVSVLGFERAPAAPLSKDTDMLRDRATTSNGLKPTRGGRPIR